MSPVSPAQIRAARSILGWSMLDLADRAHVSVSTIKRCEDGREASTSIGLVIDALETAGVRFLTDDGNGAGLRYRPR